jgi:hypothetical protein
MLVQAASPLLPGTGSQRSPSLALGGLAMQIEATVANESLAPVLGKLGKCLYACGIAPICCMKDIMSKY